MNNQAPGSIQKPFLGEKVLITGASGFIGSHLCRRLYQTGIELHAVSRAKRPAHEDKLQWWQGDLSDSATARDVVQAVKPDVIFHLASHVMGARSLENVLPTIQSNLLSTVNIMAAASKVGCRRIVLTNSLEEPEPGDPTSIPSSPYAAAKWASSGYARMFHALYQLPVVILRLFMVYGPAQQDLGKIIPYVTLSLLRGEAPRLTSGRRDVDWIYIEDVVDGIIAAAQANEIEGKTIDIGSGELVPIRKVVEHLVRLANPTIQPVFGALPERPLEQVRAADTARSNALLGWKALVSLEQGLKRTTEWYGHQLKNGGLA
jgi:nucleoside-diphosphate-sugar epimerase